MNYFVDKISSSEILLIMIVTLSHFVDNVSSEILLIIILTVSC